jgi:hypothetical protein
MSQGKKNAYEWGDCVSRIGKIDNELSAIGKALTSKDLGLTATERKAFEDRQSALEGVRAVVSAEKCKALAHITPKTSY